MEADFSGGTLSSDGGVLLLRQVDAGLGLTHRLAACFQDGRQQVYVDHSVPQLLAQRLYGSIDLEDDLVTRNGVARPGFVPGGAELEVLSE